MINLKVRTEGIKHRTDTQSSGFPTGVENMGGSSKFDDRGGLKKWRPENLGKILQKYL